MAVSGGALMMLCTPHGRRDAFFEASRNGGDEWERYTVTAENCPRTPPDFLEAEKKGMPESRFFRTTCSWGLSPTRSSRSSSRRTNRHEVSGKRGPWVSGRLHSHRR
ncbi:MAG: hypothetical protein JOZ19_01580 [Rubrobacter sp.]|nr:hypothetical protein [Rubrobacter sp.]